MIFSVLSIILVFFVLQHLIKTKKAIKLIKFYHTNTKHDIVMLITYTTNTNYYFQYFTRQHNKANRLLCNLYVHASR